MAKKYSDGLYWPGLIFLVIFYIMILVNPFWRIPALVLLSPFLIGATLMLIWSVNQPPQPPK